MYKSDPIFDREITRLQRSVSRGETDPRTLAEVKAVVAGRNSFDAIISITHVIRERELSARGNLERLFRPEATL